ncbi:HIRA-interacting protein 3 isoform X2 [Pseudophryne corroboree]|uniref:HIRA-interacting protein 3 isoform X2 n=1 Tax=Pseudophryne corroboree TaxID=495146 RepID=UPI003081A18F
MVYCSVMSQCLPLSVLSHSMVRSKFLAHSKRSSLSSQERQTLKKIVEQELLKMQEEDASDDEPLITKVQKRGRPNSGDDEPGNKQPPEKKRKPLDGGQSEEDSGIEQRDSKRLSESSPEALTLKTDQKGRAQQTVNKKEKQAQRKEESKPMKGSDRKETPQAHVRRPQKGNDTDSDIEETIPAGETDSDAGGSSNKKTVPRKRMAMKRAAGKLKTAVESSENEDETATQKTAQNAESDSEAEVADTRQKDIQKKRKARVGKSQGEARKKTGARQNAKQRDTKTTKRSQKRETDSESESSNESDIDEPVLKKKGGEVKTVLKKHKETDTESEPEVKGKDKPDKDSDSDKEDSEDEEQAVKAKPKKDGDEEEDNGNSVTKDSDSDEEDGNSVKKDSDSEEEQSAMKAVPKKGDKSVSKEEESDEDSNCEEEENTAKGKKEAKQTSKHNGVKKPKKTPDKHKGTGGKDKKATQDSDSQDSEEEDKTDKKVQGKDGGESDSSENSESSKKEKSDKMQGKVTSKEDHPSIVRLKRYVLTCGARRNYKKLFQDCRSVKSMVQVLKNELEELGVKGNPSLEKCRVVRLKREEAAELAELDTSNILPTVGRPRRRNTWNPYKTSPSRDTSPSDYRKDVASDSEGEEGPPRKKRPMDWSCLKGIISDDGDSE